MDQRSWEFEAEKTDWRGVTLHRAKDVATGRVHLLEDFALAAAAKERVRWEIATGLEAEIERGRRVEHPALRRPSGVTRHGGRFYLVREDDPPLWESWGPEPRPSGPEMLGDWLITLAEVVRAFQEADLLPRGVARVDLVASGRGLLVLDPLAQAYLADYRDRPTNARWAVAPEIQAGAEWTPAAVQFALGITAFWLAAGSPPFPGDGVSLALEVYETAILDPRRFAPRLDGGLVPTILSLLARDPAKRPTVGTLLDELAVQKETGAWIAGTGESRSRLTRGNWSGSLLRHGKLIRAFFRRNRLAMIGGLVAAGLISGLILTRERASKPVITNAMGPSQVVDFFYQALSSANDRLLDEALAPGTGREIKRAVMLEEALSRIGSAYGASDPQAGTASDPLQLRELEITKLGDDPPAYRASYKLRIQQDLIVQVFPYQDQLRLGRIKDRRAGWRWAIVEFRHEVGTPAERSLLPYDLAVPEAYYRGKQDSWPLVIYLHGEAERGDDPDLVRSASLPKLAAEKAGLPFLLLAPQCPANRTWPEANYSVSRLIDEICAKYRVDIDRLYLTGEGLGGTGVWDLAAAAPNRYAAIAPLDGEPGSLRPGALRSIPVWAFRRERSGASAAAVRALTEGLASLGTEAKLTIEPEAAGSLGSLVYRRPELLSWLLAHRRP